jgi:hypothetical protein
MISACGSNDSSPTNTQNNNSMNGVWKFTSYIYCNGNIEYADDIDFEAYIKIENNKKYTYIYSEGTCYYCSIQSQSGWGEEITPADYVVSGNTLTHSSIEDDDDNPSTPECIAKNIFEKVDASAIEGAVDNCETYEEID